MRKVNSRRNRIDSSVHKALTFGVPENGNWTEERAQCLLLRSNSLNEDICFSIMIYVLNWVHTKSDPNNSWNQISLPRTIYYFNVRDTFPFSRFGKGFFPQKPCLLAFTVPHCAAFFAKMLYLTISRQTRDFYLDFYLLASS